MLTSDTGEINTVYNDLLDTSSMLKASFFLSTSPFLAPIICCIDVFKKENLFENINDGRIVFNVGDYTRFKVLKKVVNTIAFPFIDTFDFIYKIIEGLNQISNTLCLGYKNFCREVLNLALSRKAPLRAFILTQLLLPITFIIIILVFIITCVIACYTIISYPLIFIQEIIILLLYPSYLFNKNKLLIEEKNV